MREDSVVLNDLSGGVLFVGSMLSSDIKTNLPAGGTVSAGLVARLVRPAFDDCPPDLGITTGDINRIERIALGTPFEVLLQHHPEPGKAKSILAGLYRSGKPNDFHGAIRDLVAAGKISTVVTTNYDTCIETALKAGGSVNLVVRERHAQATDLKDQSHFPIVFKIHGCAADEDTIVFRLSEEGALPPWKRTFLADLVENRDVYVIGYSGLDFDICPVLFGLEYRRLLWLLTGSDFDAALARSSPNLQNVHRNAARYDRVFGVLGGFDKAFERPAPAVPLRFQMTRAPTDVVERLFEGEKSDPFKYDLWRGDLLHAISCRVGSEAVYRRFSPQDQNSLHSQRLWADTLERAGRYEDSIVVLRGLERMASKSSLHDNVLELLFHIAGRYYTSYRPLAFLKARREFQDRFRAFTDNKVAFDSELAEAMEVYLSLLAVKAFGILGPLGRLISSGTRKKLRSGALQRAAELRYLRGEWQDLRLLRSGGADIGISVDVRDPHGSNVNNDLLLTSVDAFLHANNIVGQASAYRRDADKVSRRCEELLEALVAFGHSPEFWKAFSAFSRHISARRRDLYQGFALKELLKCQYPFIVKSLFFAQLRMKLAVLRQ